MLMIGLTGGIGSGKSTVARLLEERGAVIVDADAIVHELQRPGEPVLDAMVEAFGDDILSADGTLDRAAMASRVFGDEEALATLNGIVHPAVRDELARRVIAQADTDNIVIMDVPLLTESGMDGLEGVIVVDLDPEVAVARLVQQRGFEEADARARIARQADRDERRALATWIVDNGGSQAELVVRVDHLWLELQRLRDRSDPSDPSLRYGDDPD